MTDTMYRSAASHVTLKILQIRTKSLGDRKRVEETGCGCVLYGLHIKRHFQPQFMTHRLLWIEAGVEKPDSLTTCEEDFSAYNPS